MQNAKPIVLFDIDDILFDTATFIESGLSEYKLYEEVTRTLDSLNSFVTLGIFSKGENQFQKTKLEKTGLLKFFNKENIYIFKDKNANLTQVVNKYRDSKVFLVDDRLEILYFAKNNAKQIFTVWVKRGRYVESQKPIAGFTPDAKVENLEEVVRIVKSNL